MSEEFDSPVVATHGATDPAAPLVVLLHGRGASERDMLALAAHLPTGPAYAAVRAPIAEGGGFAWFQNRGIGRPVAASLRATMDWFLRWLDGVAGPERPVLLVGFSGGAAFAGGLALDRPDRFDGVAILHGTLPFDAGVPTDPGRLAHLPAFVAQGDADRVIPAELLERTWTYLLGESGAPTVAFRHEGGHELTVDTVHRLGGWIADRVTYRQHRRAATVGPRDGTGWPTLPDGRLDERPGQRPQVSWTIPQQQLTQTAPTDLQRRLFDQISSLPGVAVAPSRISVPGARAFTLREGNTDEAAFLVPQVGEFAHLHPEYDGSLHLALPEDQAADVCAKGWGRPHMWAGTRLSPGFVMIHGPRDEAELAVVAGIVRASHAYATASAA